MIEFVEFDWKWLMSHVALRLLNIHTHFHTGCKWIVVDRGGRGIEMTIELKTVAVDEMLLEGVGGVGRNVERVVH